MKLTDLDDAADEAEAEVRIQVDTEFGSKGEAKNGLDGGGDAGADSNENAIETAAELPEVDDDGLDVVLDTIVSELLDNHIDIPAKILRVLGDLLLDALVITASVGLNKVDLGLGLDVRDGGDEDGGTGIEVGLELGGDLDPHVKGSVDIDITAKSNGSSGARLGSNEDLVDVDASSGNQLRLGWQGVGQRAGEEAGEGEDGGELHGEKR